MPTFPFPYTQTTESTCAPIRGQDLPIHLPPLRPSFGTMDFYQDPKAGCSSRMGAGDEGNILHRRHSPNGRVQGETTRPGVCSRLGCSDDLSLKLLTYKTVFLLAVTCPSRSTDLCTLDMTRMQSHSNGTSFLPNTLAKQSSHEKSIESFFFPSFSTNMNICPVNTLRVYLTEQLLYVKGREGYSFHFSSHTEQLLQVLLPGGYD